jgi:hypothetical protein
MNSEMLFNLGKRFREVKSSVYFIPSKFSLILVEFVLDCGIEKGNFCIDNILRAAFPIKKKPSFEGSIILSGEGLHSKGWIIV